MITSKINWFKCGESMPVECRDILYCGKDGSVHSGYFLDEHFVEPCDDGESLKWKPQYVVMWAYLSRPMLIQPVVECVWRPYDYEDDSWSDKPYHFESVIFVSDAIGGKPAVYNGYYDQFKKLFISYQEDFRFSGAKVQYWMPLPKPPQEDKE